MMVDQEAEKFWMQNRDKKMFKVHVDITVQGQFTSRVIPMSIKILADSEQEAKNIARHVKISNVSVQDAKLEFDFGKYNRDHENNEY